MSPTTQMIAMVAAVATVGGGLYLLLKKKPAKKAKDVSGLLNLNGL